METTIYLQGWLSADGRKVTLPLSSCAVLLVLSYTEPSAFRLAFVRTADSSSDSCTASTCVFLPYSGLCGLHHEFILHTSVPCLVGNVLLPAVLDPALPMVRSGLCVVVRHVVRVADAVSPMQGLLHLLGFRQGSLRMCAEVSGWTKLCEVELPYSVARLVHQVHSLSAQPTTPRLQVALPADLMRLEAHFEKPPKVHNDDRHRRRELSTLQADMADPDKRGDILRSSRLDGSSFVVERATQLPHGWRKFRVHKEVVGVRVGDGEGRCQQPPPKACKCVQGKACAEQMCQLIHSLNYLDITFVHLYSEGVEMTIADLCLFSYFYFLLECLQFEVCALEEHLPRVVAWLRHMVTLPRLQQAASRCSFDLPRLQQALVPPPVHVGTENGCAEGGKQKSGTAGLEESGSTAGGNQNSCAGEGGERNSTEGGREKSSALGGDGKGVCFCRPPMDDVTEDDMELSRRCRTKYRALKPEVQQALNCMKERGIEPVLGGHPAGQAVKLDWTSLPASVHPREGEVPAKRVERKCQQLENLVTAVMAVAQPGDVIVDFCSGGGHLGLAIAHMLPDCTVYLVENKEESLLRAQSRMAALSSNNVVLYQCNLDYFVGQFEVGVCLHACGSATDMVLHLCLLQQAAFVICPCCYGSIQQTHLLTYPRSQLYRVKDVTYKEFLTLGHAADQTEFNIALEKQGRQCMNLVDADRAQLAREAGYTVTLTSLQPLTCSPKNNLLIGHKHSPAAAPS